jgi:hypothetical protein
MSREVEITSLDLRHEGRRVRNRGREGRLLSSIAQRGIEEPLEGVDTEGARVLLNGFKRYRCARKLGMGMVPYASLGEDEASAIVALLRIPKTQGLSILEQAGFVDELRSVHGLSVAQIAELLSRSKGWVSMRVGLIGEMSEAVRGALFSGAFPIYPYLYTVRRFMRMNAVSKGDVDTFVSALSGKALSVREVEQLAHGYFRGPASFREQIVSGNLALAVERIDRIGEDPDGCTSLERGLLKNLELIGKSMQRVMGKSQDPRLKSRAFHAEANLLTAGILGHATAFFQTMRQLHDRSGQA